jgi:hypothetical protein
LDEAGKSPQIRDLVNAAGLGQIPDARVASLVKGNRTRFLISGVALRFPG